MIHFPSSLARLPDGELRAGGTDLGERRRRGVSGGPVVDLRDVPDLDTLVAGRVGARVTVAALAAHPDVVRDWPGLAKAAGALATPQIRAVATVGGSLCQRSRCSYFRDPDIACAKKGGDDCPARTGDHIWHTLYDIGGCVAVHPSTVACALLAYDAGIEVQSAQGSAVRTIVEFLGDGHDATREHTLAANEVLTAVILPQPVREKAAYFRVAHRARAEWPLAEVVVRRTPAGARVAVGGVAATPLRLFQVERALDEGGTLEQAASVAAAHAKPLPGTAYKAKLLEGAVLTALEMAG
jgi:xanthine dehydrogenase YagS FAD-binding subunit